MILLDTDSYTLHQRGQERLLERCRTANEAAAITIITQIEVLRGRHEALFKVENGARLLQAQQALALTVQHMMQFPIVFFDHAAAAEFDRLRGNKKLRKIGRGDLLLAAIRASGQNPERGA
jgi:predicted nucleic acid-binding protein